MKLIGIAGASGAGKSVLSSQLLQQLNAEFGDGSVGVISEDCYYLAQGHLSFEEREGINYDHPDSLEHELMVAQLTQLQRGETIPRPEYDYSIHDRKSEPVKVSPPRLLIVEGILLFHDRQLRELFDLRVFVDVALDTCLIRRLRRDIRERGRSLDSVLKQYEQTVRPMFFEFVQPSMQHADLIVPHGGENQAALSVLRSHLADLLDSTPS